MLSAVKNLPGPTPRLSDDYSSDLRRSPDVAPLSLSSLTSELAPSSTPRNEAQTPAVALVLVVDSTDRAIRDLERDFGAKAVAIAPSNVEHFIPANVQAAVQKILATLQARLSTGSSVTAIPIDLNLSLRSPHAEPVLHFPGLRIDRAGREVHSDAGPVILTKGEFDLLTFLAENAGVAFSRPELVDSCRGGDHFLDYRAIDVQVFGLRKKLGNASWHVQTVRGFGYRFVSDPAESFDDIRRPR